MIHGGYEMEEVEDHYPSYTASAVHVSPMTGYQQVTTKIPPAYDGRASWFAYEEALEDWCDITELPPEKRGPALRNRLDGDAAIYKTLLDRELLRDADNGVTYFKATLRPYFVKGSQSVFMWRFFQLFKSYRGTADLLRWLGRISVLRHRIREAWMDLSEPVPVTDALDPRDKLEVGVFDREGDKDAVDEAVIDGVGVDEPVPDTVAVRLPEVVLVIEPVPEILGEVDADAPSVREEVGVFETEALRVAVDDGVDDGVGVPVVVLELVAV
jgi:hypothetical protein